MDRNLSQKPVLFIFESAFVMFRRVCCTCDGPLSVYLGKRENTPDNIRDSVESYTAAAAKDTRFMFRKLFTIAG